MKQQGAALIIVLVLLSVSLVIGMSGMNAALIDERLAGNYRASALAQMNAERAAVKGVEEHSADSWQEAEEVTKESLRAMDYATFVASNFVTEICDDEPGYGCSYGYAVIEGEDHVVALGSVYDAAGLVVAKSMPIFVKLGDVTGGGKPGADVELEAIFGHAGMLARQDVEIENDRRFGLYGNVLYGRDFESEGNFNDQDGGVSKLDDDFPELDVNEKFEQLIKQLSDESEGGECRLDNSGGSRVGLCAYSDGRDFDETTFSNVTIDARGDVEFKKAAHFSNVTIISDDKVEFSEGSTFFNVTILAEGQVKIDEALLFSNVYIVAKDKIEINNALGFSNVTLISDDDVEVELEKGNVEGGWFYADGEIELKMENGDAFEGSLVAGKDIELETENSFTFRHRNRSGGLLGGGTQESEPGEWVVKSWGT